MARKRKDKAPKTRNEFDPISTCLTRETTTEYPPIHLISLPSEVRQRILLSSIDESTLESKHSIVERIVELSRIHRVFRNDMAWVGKHWLSIWKRMQENHQRERKVIDSWISESITRIRQQHISIPRSTNRRPCKNCRGNWKTRKVSGIRPLCKDCRSRGLILSFHAGTRSFRWGRVS